MRNLKILIWSLEKPDDDSLNRTFAALRTNYGVQNIDIAGVVGEYTLSLEGRDLPNIAPNKLPEVAFDYIVVTVGGGIKLTPTLSRREKILPTNSVCAVSNSYSILSFATGRSPFRKFVWSSYSITDSTGICRCCGRFTARDFPR